MLVSPPLRPEAEEQVQVVNTHSEGSEPWQEQDSTQPAAMSLYPQMTPSPRYSPPTERHAGLTSEGQHIITSSWVIKTLMELETEGNDSRKFILHPEASKSRPAGTTPPRNTPRVAFSFVLSPGADTTDIKDTACTRSHTDVVQPPTEMPSSSQRVM